MQSLIHIYYLRLTRIACPNYKNSAMAERPSLTSRTVFASEVDPSMVVLTSRRVWLPETSKVSPSCPLPSPTSASALIAKPPGEVTELNKGGYTLEKVLNWERHKYLAVQVVLDLVFITKRRGLVLSDTLICRNLFGREPMFTLIHGSHSHAKTKRTYIKYMLR